ncbi:46077_t:CDS:2, partial [Gigaspora margarita]
HELELKLYLSSILEELVVEKNEKFNAIDMTIKNQKGTGSHSKWCKKCNTTNIDNKKRTCPNCNEKLDILAILQAESASELTQINTASQSKSLLRRTLFNMIGHADNESSGAGFLNSQDDNRTFKSLGGEHLLSEQLKNFSNLACERRIKLINETFKDSKSNSSPRPIPITAQEAAAAMDEKNMTKKELLAIINSLLNSINTSDCPSYRGLLQKTNAELLEILQRLNA